MKVYVTCLRVYVCETTLARCCLSQLSLCIYVGSLVSETNPQSHSYKRFEFLSLTVFGPLSSSLLVFSTTFQPIYPPAFFRCLSNSGNYTELRTTSFVESTGSTVRIPLVITGHKYSVFLYFYSPATSR